MMAQGVLVVNKHPLNHKNNTLVTSMEMITFGHLKTYSYQFMSLKINNKILYQNITSL